MKWAVLKRTRLLGWAKGNPLVVGAAVVALILIIIPIITYAIFARDLGSKESIMNRNDTGVTLLDMNDQPFYSFYEAKTDTYVGIDQVAEQLQQAVVAAEDEDFYTHAGFSPKAISAALYADVTRQELRYGGSTITQQLVKNTLLTKKKSFLRKYQELVLAIEIDRRFSKDEILEMYLNSAYFGEGAFGVEPAAQTYFAKPAHQLNLAEAALLVGMLPAPSVASPISGDAVLARSGQELVLSRMVEQEFISQQDQQAALAQPLSFQRSLAVNQVVAPHFALMVRDQLIEEYGEERVARSGFKVKTSLNRDWQAAAEAALKEQLANLTYRQVTNGAVVITDPRSGEIRVLVGSRDWHEPTFGKTNMAISPRQPGSSFKPIYYAAALDKRIITAATVLKDEPKTFADGYSPQNFDFRFRGDVLVRRALGNSLNIPSVEVMSKLGVEEALQAAADNGITTLEDANRYGLSLALGSGEVPLLEMTAAYGSFANGGNRHQPTPITAIISKQGDEVFKYRPRPERAVSAEAAFLISSILSDPNSRSETFGSQLNTSKQAAVKTGSTENYEDAWTLGYTPEVVVGVWVGNNDRSPTNNVAGSVGAGTIWRNLIERFTANSAITNFYQPPGITSLTVCSGNGLVASRPTEKAYVEYFIRGTEPAGRCDDKNKEKENERQRDQDDDDRGNGNGRNRGRNNDDD